MEPCPGTRAAPAGGCRKTVAFEVGWSPAVTLAKELFTVVCCRTDVKMRVRFSEWNGDGGQ